MMASRRQMSSAWSRTSSCDKLRRTTLLSCLPQPADGESCLHVVIDAFASNEHGVDSCCDAAV